MDKKIGLFWLRDDFRVARNDGLIEATRNHNQVVVFYLYKEELFKVQEAQKWWISKSLLSFRKQLSSFNINLKIIKANSFKTFFDNLVKKKDFSIYWNKVYEPDYLKFDEYLINILKNKNINHKRFKGNSLNENDEIKKSDGTPFKVFTPFWRNAEKYYIEKIPPLEKKINKCKKKIDYFENTIEPEKILPNKNWFKNFEKIWLPEEQNALKELQNFIKDRITNYSDGRNFPFKSATSKLSPFIKFGQLHVETIWSECLKKKSKNIGITKFFAEIGWREFNHSLINNFPYMLRNNYSKKFDKFPWEKNSKFLNAWKKGLTGYPIVDAGMRELSSTGWMHNRVRMIVGSFLVKHLLIDWKEGEKYFRNCLLDYSPANNVAGWQWVAGCGADAAPYFRIFNPILQGEKFDKEGDGSFYYPKKGIWSIFDKMIEVAGKDYFQSNNKVTEIFHKDNKITSIKINDQKIFETELVVSSIPIEKLIKCLNPPPPKEILDYTQYIKYRNLFLVIFLLDKESVNNNGSMYYPSKEFCFTRIYEPRNRSKFMSPPNKTSLVVEIPIDKNEKFEENEKTELILKVKNQLLEIGFFNIDQVIKIESKYLSNAYPILDTKYDENLIPIKEYLSQFGNLILNGRNGKFQYNHIHDHIKDGREIVNNLSNII